MSFLDLQFSQKKNEKIQLYYYGTSSRIVFVHFLGELKTPKRHLESNWPLACGAKFLLSSTINKAEFAQEGIFFALQLFAW